MLSCACKKSRHIKSLRKTNPCNGAHAKRATMRGDTHIYMRASLRIGHREVTYVHYTPGWISPRVRSVLDIVIAGVLSFCRDYVQRACLSLSPSSSSRPHDVGRTERHGERERKTREKNISPLSLLGDQSNGTLTTANSRRADCSPVKRFASIYTYICD